MPTWRQSGLDLHLEATVSAREAQRVEVRRGARVELSLPVQRAPWARLLGRDSVRVRGLLPLLQLPLEAALTLERVGHDGSREVLERRAVSRAAQPALAAGGPAPLALTALGRSGSTWAMHLLAQHARIAAVERYPYEDIPGREALATFLRDRDEQALVSSIAASYGDAKFFVEKNLVPFPLLRELWPKTREVFLVRDFRDVIASSLAFNRKRGYDAFGREQVGSDVEFVHHRARMARPWVLEPWRERGASAHLLRYEDLVTRPHETLSALFEYLGLELDVQGLLERANARQADLGGHRTSADPAASIGRWRQDLSPELVRACEQAFGELLQAFGYD